MSAPALRGPLAPALFKVISGRPSPEELAAVTALLTALSASASAAASDSVTDAEAGTAPAVWGRPEHVTPASWMARRRAGPDRRGMAACCRPRCGA